MSTQPRTRAYSSPPQRKPLSEEVICQPPPSAFSGGWENNVSLLSFMSM